MRVWDDGEDFQTLVKADADIGAHLSESQIDRVFALNTYLRNVDAIFDRVFRD
jgi:adenylosuccinate lyase